MDVPLADEYACVVDALREAKMISLPSSSSVTHKPVEKSDKSVNSTSHEHGSTSNNSLSWKTIDHYAQLTDAYSVMDTLSCSSLPAVPLWWKTEPGPLFQMNYRYRNQFLQSGQPLTKAVWKHA